MSSGPLRSAVALQAKSQYAVIAAANNTLSMIKRAHSHHLLLLCAALFSALCCVVMPSPSRAGLIGADERETFVEFAARTGRSIIQVEHTFASTGSVSCPWGRGTAFIVARNNIAVFPSHFLYRADGEAIGDPQRCDLEFKVSGVVITRKLDTSTIVIGSDKLRSNGKTEFDWVVARLRGSVPGVEPYAIGDLAVGARDTYEKRSVVQVARGQSHWAGQDASTPSVSECTVHVWDRVRANGVRLARTDCDSGFGASGGPVGILDASNRFIVWGMQTGSIDPRKSRAPFDVVSHFSYVTTIEGEFRRAIENMAAIMSVSEVQTSLTTLGYAPGPVDGKFGDRTRAAMHQFLVDNGIPASDEISLELSDALKRALKRRKTAH